MHSAQSVLGVRSTATRARHAHATVVLDLRHHSGGFVLADLSFVAVETLQRHLRPSWCEVDSHYLQRWHCLQIQKYMN